MILQKKQIEPDVFNFWQQTLSLPLNFNWYPVLLFKFHELKDNKIKQLNFKLLHKLLPSRWNVCKWKIRNDNNCEICHTPEITQHNYDA